MSAPQGRIRTVCVGKVREVDAMNRHVTTGIFKEPVDGPVAAVGVNLVGDDQADRTVHGGPDKAVYAFPAEHFPCWQSAFPETEFLDGAFGENLTTEGLLEQDLCVGDLFRCGTCELRITQPRLPCFKLAIRLDDKGVLRHMLETGQTGFYFTIAREGSLQAGDDLVPIDRPENALPIAKITRAYTDKKSTADDYQALVDAPYMVDSWREWAIERIESVGR